MSKIDWDRAPSDAAVWIEDIKRTHDAGWYVERGDKYQSIVVGSKVPWHIRADGHRIKVHKRTDIEPEVSALDIELAINKSKYHKEIKKGVLVDTYDVLMAFEVTNPAMQHALKKMLAPGQRGVKDTIQDMKEAIQSIERAIELEQS